jgi:hypothetical protein
MNYTMRAWRSFVGRPNLQNGQMRRGELPGEERFGRELIPSPVPKNTGLYLNFRLAAVCG